MTTPSSGARQWLWGGALVAVTAVWGATFTLVQEAIEQLPPLTFNAVRFTIATAVLAVFAFPRLARLGPVGWRHGALLGVMLFAGYTFQTVGLQYTLATNGAFVTGMFVVFTPVLSALLLRRSPPAGAVAGVLLATAGLAALSLLGRPPTEAAAAAVDEVPRLFGVIMVGDVIIIGCAIAFAAQIIGLGAWASLHDALALTVVQLLMTALLSGASSLLFEVGRATMTWNRSVWIALLMTALLASAAGFWIQTAAQRVIPPTRTAIILTMEPVWAGVVGYVFLHETLTALGWIGCGLILAGMLVAELRGGAPPPVPPEDQTGTEAVEAPAPA